MEHAAETSKAFNSHKDYYNETSSFSDEEFLERFDEIINKSAKLIHTFRRLRDKIFYTAIEKYGLCGTNEPEKVDEAYKTSDEFHSLDGEACSLHDKLWERRSKLLRPL